MYLEKILDKYKSVLNKKIIVKCQKNSLYDNNIYLIWINKIFLFYRYKIIKKDCNLIQDNVLPY